MSKELIEVLENIRASINQPLIVNCGVRCPSHNAEVGGVSNSQHLYGIAADLSLPDGYSVDEFAKVAEDAGADGIGKYDWGIHVDKRGYAARWDYRS
jgi:uncharacterized protein YcbK (DUF882 family)